MTTDSPRPVNLDLTLPGDLHPDLLQPFVPVVLVTEKPPVRAVLLGPDPRPEGSRAGPWLGALAEAAPLNWPLDWPPGQVTVSLDASHVAIDLLEAAGRWRVAVWVETMGFGPHRVTAPEGWALYRAHTGVPMTGEEILCLRSLALRVAERMKANIKSEG